MGSKRVTRVLRRGHHTFLFSLLLSCIKDNKKGGGKENIGKMIKGNLSSVIDKGEGERSDC